MLIELSDVRKRYGAHEALRGLTLSVEPGSIGLLGPNGAGKSTLLKLLLGLIPFDGAATVLGHDARKNSIALRAQVGYMPERDCHLPGLNAVEMCAYSAELAGLPPPEALARAHAALEFAGLGDKRYQLVDGYSTGMKQRVKLAQAIAHDPKLLFLDEPTNGLDPAGRTEMLELVAALPARTGCSVVLSSHLLPDVERVCTQAILLHQGELLYAGKIAALQNKDQEDTWEVRVKSGEDKLAEALRARGCTVESEGALLAVRTKLERPTEIIFECARQNGLQVRHLAPRRLTLESAFLRAVEEAS